MFGHGFSQAASPKESVKIRQNVEEVTDPPCLEQGTKDLECRDVDPNDQQLCS